MPIIFIYTTLDSRHYTTTILIIFLLLFFFCRSHPRHHALLNDIMMMHGRCQSLHHLVEPTLRHSILTTPQNSSKRMFGSSAVTSAELHLKFDKILRLRVYNTKYWKTECFALTVATLIDKASEIEYVGGTYGANRRRRHLFAFS